MRCAHVVAPWTDPAAAAVVARQCGTETAARRRESGWDLFDRRRLLPMMEIVGTVLAAGFAVLVLRGLAAPAVALDSVSVNISRAVGPALAGVFIGAWGLASPYAVYAVCNLACIAALFWWHPASLPTKKLPSERFGNAILVGLRHARYNRPLRATLARAAGFFLFASAYWALLPPATDDASRPSWLIRGPSTCANSSASPMTTSP